ncbi:MAG: polymer-forming cytoskeletal protein [Fidelibacterota bacterium]
MTKMSRSEKQDKNISTIIGPKVEVQGSISAEGGLLVYGVVIGDIHTNGLVRLSQGSYVKGVVNAGDVRISGTLDGDLIVARKAELGSKSVVTGNLTAKILVIEEGARFEGICQMSKKKSVEAQPDLETDETAGEK